MKDPDDIEEFLTEYKGVDTDSEPETITQYTARLKIIKQATDCKDLEHFFDSEEHWKRLNNWVRSKKNLKKKPKSKHYEYSLKAALIKYHTIMFRDKAKPFWLRLPKLKKYTGEDSNSMDDLKDELTKFLMAKFPKIYTVDLEDYSANEFKRERDRMMCILGLFAGERRGELKRALVSDFDPEKKLVEVRDKKGGKRYFKPVPEDKFWECLKDYLEVKDASDYNSKYLFPSTSTKNAFRYGESISHIISEMGKYTWGTDRFFSHILKHTRLTELSQYLDPYGLHIWAGHTSMNTTMLYLGRHRMDARVMEGLAKKSQKDWI